MSDNVGGGPCAVCGLSSGQRCSRCQAVFYCGAEHQTQHWQQHRQQCSPAFQEHYSEEHGKHLVATRIIKEGTLIFKEKPIVVDPMTMGQLSVLSCGSCSVAVPDPGEALCVCGVPLCAPRCVLDLGARSLHTAAECRFLREAGAKDKAKGTLEMFSTLTPNCLVRSPGALLLAALGVVRCLLLSGCKLRALEALESHEERAERMRKAGAVDTVMVFEFGVEGMVHHLLSLFGSRWRPELVRRRGGALLAHELSYEQEQEHRRRVLACAVYEHASLVSPSCRPNARLAAFGKEAGDLTMGLVATEDIPAGRRITAAFVPLLKPTATRQLALAKRLAVCRCERCRDPTECGTRLNSICCRRCRDRQQPMSVLVLTGTGVWRCSACGLEMSEESVEGSLNLLKARERAAFVSTEPAALEAMLARMLYPRGLLHPTAAAVIALKGKIVEGYFGGNLSGVPDAALSRVLSLCRELLQVGDALAPGLSALRGGYLWRLLCALLETGRRKALTRHGEAHAVLREAEERLSEVKRIFVEPGMQREITLLSEGLDEVQLLLSTSVLNYLSFFVLFMWCLLT